MGDDTLLNNMDKISDLEKKMEEAKVIGDKLNYSEEEVNKIDKEIYSIKEKLDSLLEQRNKIVEHLEEVKRLNAEIEYSKSKLQARQDDFSKEELLEQLKQVFQSYLNEQTDDLEKQVYNKLALLLIEYNILRPLYAEKDEMANKIYATENDVSYEDVILPPHENEKSKFSLFKKKEEPKVISKRISKKEDEGTKLYSDLVFTRTLEIGEILEYIWGDGKTIWHSDFNTYKEAIDGLKNNPEDVYNCNPLMTIDDKYLLDKEMAQKLYEELLVPYYIQMGFPVKEENGKDKPYAFVLGKFDGDKNCIQNSTQLVYKVESIYREKGADLKDYVMDLDYSDHVYGDEGVGAWMSETVFLSPNEINLLNKINFVKKYKDRLVEHTRDRMITNMERSNNYVDGQEKSSSR